MIRFQLDLDEIHQKQIDAMMVKSGSTSKRELMLNAITFLNWAMKQKELGNTVGAFKPDGTRIEYNAPVFEYLSAVQK